MKVEVNLKRLNEMVGVVGRAVANRPQLPVLSNILLSAESTGLRLSATDLEIGMTVFVPAKVEEVGKTTVPARIFLDYLGSLTGEKVELIGQDGKLLIAAGTYSSQIQTMEADEFPPLSFEVAAQVEVEAAKLTEILAKVMYAAAKDSMRPILTGVLFEMEGERLRVVSTDGFRLAMAQTKIGKVEKSAWVVPVRAIAEIIKLSKGGKVGLTYLPETKQVVVATPEVTLMAQALEGNFPDYNRILPKSAVLSFSANREELLQVVRSVAIFARDNSNVMRWRIAEGELSALGEAGERGQAKASCAVAITEGEETTVVFNAKYVMDFLTNLNCENVMIALGAALAPGAFRQDGDEDYLYVVMPINA